MESLSDNTLKIVISGPNASGKTTLARAISERYNIPVIEEDVAQIFNGQAAFEKLRFERAPLDQLVQAKAAWINSFSRWTEHRSLEYAKHPGFVADRWEADLLDFWLVLMRNEKNVDQLTVQFAKNLQERAKTLDLVIVMPFGAPFTHGKNDADMTRATTLANRLLNTVVTAGIMQSLSDVRILRIPPTMTSVEDRLKLVGKSLSGAK